MALYQQLEPLPKSVLVVAEIIAIEATTAVRTRMKYRPIAQVY